MKIKFILLTVVLLLQSYTSFGRIEHHKIESVILAKAGFTKERELTVYIPKVPALSRAGYPVVYLLHGYTGTNRSFIGEGYNSLPFPPFQALKNVIHVDLMMDDMTAKGIIQPMIVVLPDMNRRRTFYDVYTHYITEEIIPFVDSTYSTNATREYRAIAGHSMGGSDAFFIAIRRPDLFRIVVAYAPYFWEPPSDNILGGYDNVQNPLDFWLYAGTNDQFTRIPVDIKKIIRILNTHDISYKVIIDENDHWVMIKKCIEESLQYISDQFGGAHRGAEIE